MTKQKHWKSYLSALLCAALLLGLLLPCGTLTALAVEPMDYHRDGLIAWYDGTNNGNGIRDPQIDYWRDLTGNGNHLDLRYMLSQNAISWSDNALMVDSEKGLYLLFSPTINKLFEDRAYTVELVLGEVNYDATELVTLLSSSNGELSFGFDVEENGALTLAYRHGFKNTQYPTVPNAEGYFGNRTLAITSDAASPDGTADGLVTLYSDGAPLASEQVGYSLASDYLHLGHRTPEHRWGGEIHAVRIYDRVLSAEELAANAEADRFNYRQGNSIDSVEWYDPNADAEWGECFLPIPPPDYNYTEKRMALSSVTDMIPLTGFYGAINVGEYLYPYAHGEYDCNIWEGARVVRTEENMTDYEGNELDYVKLNILYGSACNRFFLEPVSGGEARYVVLKSVFEAEFDTLTVGVLGYDSGDEVIFEKTYSADEVAAMMGGEPYLILDTEGLLDGADRVYSIWMRLDGMERENPIYLEELVFCADEAEVETYTGISLSATETTAETSAETDPETSPETSESTTPQTDAPIKPSVTESDTTGGEGTQRGCASAVGAGSVILLALCAAVVFRKRKE